MDASPGVHVGWSPGPLGATVRPKRIPTAQAAKVVLKTIRLVDGLQAAMVARGHLFTLGDGDRGVLQLVKTRLRTACGGRIPQAPTWGTSLQIMQMVCAELMMSEQVTHGVIADAYTLACHWRGWYRSAKRSQGRAAARVAQLFPTEAAVAAPLADADVATAADDAAPVQAPEAATVADALALDELFSEDDKDDVAMVANQDDAATVADDADEDAPVLAQPVLPSNEADSDSSSYTEVDEADLEMYCALEAAQAATVAAAQAVATVAEAAAAAEDPGKALEATEAAQCAAATVAEAQAVATVADAAAAAEDPGKALSFDDAVAAAVKAAHVAAAMVAPADPLRQGHHAADEDAPGAATVAEQDDEVAPLMKYQVFTAMLKRDLAYLPGEKQSTRWGRILEEYLAYKQGTPSAEAEACMLRAATVAHGGPEPVARDRKRPAVGSIPGGPPARARGHGRGRGPGGRSAGQFGCSKCRGSAKGCLKCNPSKAVGKVAPGAKAATAANPAAKKAAPAAKQAAQVARQVATDAN